MEEQTLFSQIIEGIIYFGILLGIIFVVQRIADVVFNKYFERVRIRAIEKGTTTSGKRYKTLAATFKKLTSALLWGLFILLALHYFGFNVALLLTGAGAAGIIFGIAGKDIIMDYYTGAMVLIEDQYRVGDVIRADLDHAGVVENITLRTVVLRDIDGNVHVVPHRLAPAVVNMTYGFSKVNIEVGVAYDSDMEKVKKVINELGLVLVADKDWKELFIEPVSYDRILRFDDSQITVRVLGKVLPGEQWAAMGEYNKRLIVAFEENDIEIPFPQRVIHNVTDKPKKAHKVSKKHATSPAHKEPLQADKSYSD